MAATQRLRTESGSSARPSVSPSAMSSGIASWRRASAATSSRTVSGSITRSACAIVCSPTSEAVTRTRHTSAVPVCVWSNSSTSKFR